MASSQSKNGSKVSTANGMPADEPEALSVSVENLEAAQVDLSTLPLASWVKEHAQKVEAEEDSKAVVIAEKIKKKGPEEINSKSTGRPIVSRVISATVDREISREKAPPETAIAFKSRKELGLPSSLSRTALEETNAGKSRSSRHYVRGVLHPRPIPLYLASIAALLVPISFLWILVVMALVYFKVLGIKLLLTATAFPVVYIIYLLLAQKATCRVCGQREFTPSRAFKHRRAHRWGFVGPISCTALHLLIFKWFRCMFCGTAIRTKK